MTEEQSRFRAVVFDMDGVLTDSEPAFFAAVNDILARYRTCTDSEEYARFIGSATPAMWSSMIALKQLPVTLDEILEEYEAPLMQRLREPRPPLPGARELLAKLRGDGVPIGLCTASYRRWVDAILAGAGIDIAFDAYATADVVSATKPSPEPYLHAARQLAVAPHKCIAVEDSVNGLTSALAAKMHVIQLRATRTSAAPQPGVAQVLESLDQFPFDLIFPPSAR